MGDQRQTTGQINSQRFATVNTKPSAQDDPSVPFSGMSKRQLYEIMCQMKILIEQNKDQARQILIDNPAMTKALFQAQIMLGMVRPPKVMPNIQQSPSQLHQTKLEHTDQGQAPTKQPSSSPVNAVQNASLTRRPTEAAVSQHSPLPSITPTQPQTGELQSSLNWPPSYPQLLQAIQPPQGHHVYSQAPLSQSITPHPMQQSSQGHSLPMHHVTNPSNPQTAPISQVSNVFSGHSHLSLTQPTAGRHQQPILLQHPRPSMQQTPHQIQTQPSKSIGFQPSFVPMQSQSQPQSNYLPHSQQLPTLAPPPPQPLYQVTSGISAGPASYSGSEVYGQGIGQPNIGMSNYGLQPNRAPPTSQVISGIGPAMPWSQPTADSAINSSFSGSSIVRNQCPNEMQNQTVQPPLVQQQVPDQQKVLLEQVMNLTPEQINALPPEFRPQIIELQQRFRGSS